MTLRYEVAYTPAGTPIEMAGQHREFENYKNISAAKQRIAEVLKTDAYDVFLDTYEIDENGDSDFIDFKQYREKECGCFTGPLKNEKCRKHREEEIQEKVSKELNDFLKKL